jgi:hypothetical protein
VTSLQMLNNVVSEMPTLGVSDHLKSSLKDPCTSHLVVEVISFQWVKMKHRPEDTGLRNFLCHSNNKLS